MHHSTVKLETMEGKSFSQSLVVIAIVAILQLISLSSAKYYLVQIGDEDPVRPDLKTTQTPTLSTDNLDKQSSGQHGVDYNRTNLGDCGEKCACVSDPDRKIANMDDNFSGSGSRSNGKSKYCYRAWVNGFYCCYWSEYWCEYWWGK